MKDVWRAVFWIAFVFACSALGEYFHTHFFVVVAITAVFVFGNYFLIEDRRATRAEETSPSSDAALFSWETRLAPGLLGFAWATFIALSMTNWSVSADANDHVLTPLLGMQFGLPAGALLFGTFAPGGYTLAVSWAGRRTSAFDIYPIVGLSLYTLGLFQILVFFAAGFHSPTDFYVAYFVKLPIHLSGPAPLVGLAPVPALTLPLEFAGFVIAGLTAFLRSTPTSMPWSHGEERVAAR